MRLVLGRREGESARWVCGRVILKGRTSRAWPTREVGRVDGLAYLGVRGRRFQALSSDLMTWVELRYATLEASRFDEPYKVYISTYRRLCE